MRSVLNIVAALVCAFVGFCAYHASTFPFSHTSSFVPAWYQNEAFIWVGILLGAPVFFLFNFGAGLATKAASVAWAGILFWLFSIWTRSGSKRKESSNETVERTGAPPLISGPE